MNRTLLALLLLSATLPGMAQNAPLPPPEARPVGLPPAPAGALPTQLPSTSETQPRQAPPVPGAETPATTQHAFDLNVYQQGLGAEAQRLDQAIGHQMRVTVAQEGSQEQQMAISAARNERLGGYDPGALREVGPGAILATGQYGGVGGPQSQVCVVIADPERAAQAWDTYIAPALAAGSHPQTGFAWMVGHAVGHCLDAMDRQARFRGKLSWRHQEAATMGLWPDAVRAALPAGFGNTFSKDGFMNNAERIYGQGTQRQYSERVADAFATLWITRLGASPQGIQALAKARFDTVGDDAAIKAVASGRASARAGQSARADRLWDMARDVQISLGVDTALVKSNTNMGSIAAGIPESQEVVQWVVTPQGLVGVDAQGRTVQKPNTTQQIAPGRNFNDLKRFGQ